MNIFTIENFLSNDDLDMLTQYVIKRKNGILKDRKLTKYIWDNYQNKFFEINKKIVGLFEEVTITNSNKPISMHKDKKLNDSKWKILIYLNDIKNGGTIFIIDDKPCLVENKKNKLVMFDIELYHKSEKFLAQDKKNKLCIGFRAKT